MNILQLTIEHLLIVIAAMAIASVGGVILGILAYWGSKPLDSIILWVTDILQTIPSLALLTILMIYFGLGNVTLIIGLVLYALLPIVRNTHTGLHSIPAHIKDAAKGMGMSRMQRMMKVELPLAFPLIFSGIKIALVTSLSIAVIGVLIGSGGLGAPIYRGIQSRDYVQILSGAIPVVALALVLDYLMSLVEKRLAYTAK
jgi:osmoprotectant transport system permease protein